MSAVRALRNIKSQGQLKIDTDNEFERAPSEMNNNNFEYSQEPYIQNNNFAVFTPTKESIEKLYKSNSFKPQRYVNSELIEKYFSTQKDNPKVQDQVEIKSMKHNQHPATPKNRSQTAAAIGMKRSASGALTPQNLDLLNQYQETPEQKKRLESVRTSSSAKAFDGLPLKRVDVKAQQETPKIVNPGETFKKTISYPGLPWVQLDTTKRYQDPFGKSGYLRTLAAFKGTGSESVSDMMLLSRKVSLNLKQTLRQQQDKKFLERSGLIALPKTVNGPVVQKAKQGQMFIIASNDAHLRESNLGYSRKANGTFYNH